MATRRSSSEKSTGSAKKKTSGSKTTRGKARKTTRRTLIEPQKGDQRYVRRNKKGEFKKEVSVGRSLAVDRRTKSTTKAGKGQGDRGDASGGGLTGVVRKILKKL